jgi:hypothetical protein
MKSLSIIIIINSLSNNMVSTSPAIEIVDSLKHMKLQDKVEVEFMRAIKSLYDALALFIN